MKSSEEHPNRSSFVNIMHASAGGSIPAWFTNLVSLGETKRVVMLRKFAEEKQRRLSAM
jgi:hypothetical protein